MLDYNKGSQHQTMGSALSLQNFWGALCAILLPATLGRSYLTWKLLCRKDSCQDLSLQGHPVPQQGFSQSPGTDLSPWAAAPCVLHCCSLTTAAEATAPLYKNCHSFAVCWILFQAACAPRMFDPAGSARTFPNAPRAAHA